MTTIIEIQEKGLKVKMNNQITLISKYKDEKGEYFLNENLKKQYFKDTVFQKQEIEIVKIKEKEEIQEFRFEVEYEHKGRLNGFALTETIVKAKSYEKAIQKIKNNFKTIYEISEA